MQNIYFKYYSISRMYTIILYASELSRKSVETFSKRLNHMTGNLIPVISKL